MKTLCYADVATAVGRCFPQRANRPDGRRWPLLVLLWVASVAGAQAQTLNSTASVAGSSVLPTPTPFTVVSRDANSAIWQGTTYEQAPDGSIVPHVHRYVQMATGLNHLSGGQYIPSKEEINISPDGSSASATNGQHQVYFPGDIYSGVIKLVTPDGKTLESEPIGLALSDGSNSVLLAVVTNSTGAILPSGNQVIYTNAFAGLDADLLYTYTKAGMEQDVVLRQQPPDPASLGLNSAQTRIQVLTEFIVAPQPSVTAVTVPTDAGNLEDDSLGFGSMYMTRGKAFLLGTNSPSAGVEKHWVTIQGRQFLIEEIPIVSIAKAIDTLPPLVAEAGTGTNLVVSKNLILPAPRLAHASPKTVFLAQATTPSRGFVMDYVTMSSQTNWVFKGDMTYYISGTVNLSGTNCFEGGTVLKYATNASINLGSGSGLNWLGAAYRPVVMTAKDDNSIGENITGSTGNPTNYYANPALNFQSAAASPISGFRINWAKEAVEDYASGLTLQDGQLVNCYMGISTAFSGVDLRNLLFANVQQDIANITYDYVDAQNTTFAGSQYLNANLFQASLSLENCILANVTNLTNASSYLQATFTGTTNGFYSSPEFGTGRITNTFYPFQTVGAGGYYLTNGCVFTNAGTTNIDPGLLADLQQKTVWPPIVYSNSTFTTPQTFSPHAQRDTNGAPTLGYHYDPLDYAFGGCIAYSNLTFTAGTAAGWFELPGSGGPGYGIALVDQVVAAFNGTVTAPCVWARYDTVQEGGDGLWTTRGWLGGITCRYPGNSFSIYVAPQIVASFAHFFGLVTDSNHFRDYWTPLVVYARNCELHGAGAGAYNNSFYFTNCLFDDVYSGQIQGYNSANEFVSQNCTWHGGLLQLVPNYNPITLSVRDSSFDGTSLEIDYYGTNSSNAHYDYNAFTNGAPRFPIGGTHDVTSFTSFDWQTNWFGNYYLPPDSPLIDVGDVTADKVGLFHFTTETNQMIDGFSPVDIGYHYVATDQYGNPLDSNADGIPDYLEDANGNGLIDPGENAWTDDIDLDGLSGQQESLYGTNPEVSEGFWIWLSTPIATSRIP